MRLDSLNAVFAMNQVLKNFSHENSGDVSENVPFSTNAKILSNYY